MLWFQHIPVISEQDLLAKLVHCVGYSCKQALKKTMPTIIDHTHVTQCEPSEETVGIGVVVSWQVNGLYELFRICSTVDGCLQWLSCILYKHELAVSYILWTHK